VGVEMTAPMSLDLISNPSLCSAGLLPSPCNISQCKQLFDFYI
jgi:hypothetical protein